MILARNLQLPMVLLLRDMYIILATVGSWSASIRERLIALRATLLITPADNSHHLTILLPTLIARSHFCHYEARQHLRSFCACVNGTGCTY